jgi:hypothetical protein
MKADVKFTPDVFAEICERISDGRSLRSVCTDHDMPAKKTVFVWMRDIEGLSDQYARACEERAEYLAELAIIESNNENTDSGAVARDRLKVDTIKWFTSKVHPKKYGDRTQTDITSNGNTIAVAPIKWADE